VSAERRLVESDPRLHQALLPRLTYRQSELYSVVTATFAHQPTSEILDVTISVGRQSPGGLTLDQSSSQDTSSPASETIGVTASHPFCSVDHQAFVPVGLLEPGTRVKTHLDQIQTIVSLHPRPGPPEKVYNLEVHVEYVYFVGEDGILVHNSCGPYVYAVLGKDGKPRVCWNGYSGSRRYRDEKSS
jgi:hypothetical protein